VLDVLRRFEARLLAEAPDVGLRPQAIADVNGLAGLRLVGRLPEQQLLAELGREGSLVALEVEARRGRRASQENLGVAVLAVLLVGAEDEELVLDDGTANREPGLEAVVGRLRQVAGLRIPVQAHQSLVLVEEEQVARP